MQILIPQIYAEAVPLDGKTLIRHRTAKSLGELAELSFLYKAASLGFGVAKPLGDNEAFDFILNSYHRLWRVQVKSTYREGRGGRFTFSTVRAAVGGRARTYAADAIDVLAAWVMPLDLWYVIPVQAFAPRTGITVYPRREPAVGQFEAFREAWCLLACWKEGANAKGFLLDRLCQGDNQAGRTPDPNCHCGLKEAIARLQAQPPDKRRRPR